MLVKRLEQLAALVVAAGLALVSYWLFFSWAQGDRAPRPQPRLTPPASAPSPASGSSSGPSSASPTARP
ncbi:MULTISPECIES: hypothetical protein [Synechococcaceae]|uniref:hypothetical protein n=1 Tax=Synechococcaceae TaxID=1890426 RepID=UPI0008FF787A|nr:MULTISPECIES: hypothetical protein [Synechococcaceae]MCT4363909.1 hypothetical protein [Candidatus Regnicoccus frigidus MAG-AL1]MCT4367695.1 hypothetical protein [Candidatus Regnicoccus frigidus MAG-AL2]